MTPRRLAVLAPALLPGLLVAGIAGSAHAADPGAFALQTWDPPPAGDAFLAVPGAEAPGHLRPAGALALTWAHDPLVLRVDGEVPPGGRIVHRELWGFAQASLGLGTRYLVEVAAPVALYQSGSHPVAELPQVTAAGAGDLRLGARATVLSREAFTLAAALELALPTGSRAAYASDGTLRARASAVAGGRRGEVSWSAQAGLQLRTDRDLVVTAVGPALTYAAGAAWHREAFRVGPELYGRWQFSGTMTSPAEVLLGCGWSRGPWDLSAGVGTQLDRAPGAAPFRALARVTWRPAAAPPAPPPPPPDRDGDRIADAADACPDVAGVADADPARNGCPPPAPVAPPPPSDRDGDGIPDAADACPDVKGVADADPARNGCPPPALAPVAPPPPPDRDGDGIADAADACPDVKGVAHADPARNGCPPVKPTLVKITKEKLEILQAVHFETARDVIKPDSEQLLGEVAEVLNGHLEIEQVRVEGHTDSQGAPAANQDLSARRAAAVRRWLVEKGRVAEGRLAAEGYGQTQPIATNATAEGRARNRRVEFRILAQRP